MLKNYIYEAFSKKCYIVTSMKINNMFQ